MCLLQSLFWLAAACIACETMKFHWVVNIGLEHISEPILFSNWMLQKFHFFWLNMLSKWGSGWWDQDGGSYNKVLVPYCRGFWNVWGSRNPTLISCWSPECRKSTGLVLDWQVRWLRIDIWSTCAWSRRWCPWWCSSGLSPRGKIAVWWPCAHSRYLISLLRQNS